MAKRKTAIGMRSYGIYSHWDSRSKELPKILEFTTAISAVIDIKFGLIVNIQGPKN